MYNYNGHHFFCQGLLSISILRLLLKEVLLFLELKLKKKKNTAP